MIKRKFLIKPTCTSDIASNIFDIAEKYKVKIIIYDSGWKVNGNSIMGILTLPSFIFFHNCSDESSLKFENLYGNRIKKPSGEIEIEVSGEKEEDAMKELEKIFNEL
jgi:phosphotransferase system HPr-like phosphotransfer protein